MSIDRSTISISKSPNNLLNELIVKLEEIDQKNAKLSFFIERHVSEKIFQRILQVKDHEILKISEEVFKRTPMEIYNEDEFFKLTQLFSTLFAHDFYLYFNTTHLIIDEELKGLIIDSVINYKNHTKNENKTTTLERNDLFAIQSEIIKMLAKSKQPFGAYDAEVVDLLIIHLDDKNKFFRAVEIIGALGIHLHDSFKAKLVDKLILLLDSNEPKNEMHRLSILSTLGKLKHLKHLSQHTQNRLISLLKYEFPSGIINESTINRYEVALEVFGWIGAALSPLYRNKCIDILLSEMEDASKSYQKIILKSLKKIILAMNEKDQRELKIHLQAIGSDSATIFLGQLLMTAPHCNHQHASKLRTNSNLFASAQNNKFIAKKSVNLKHPEL